MSSGRALQPHLHIAPGDVGRYVFLPGDPGRAELIANRFDEPRLVATHREFLTWTGRLGGEPVSVTSTGIGGPSAAIAMEELVKTGAHTFIRVGTSGAMQYDIAQETLGVVQAATRDEGTTLHYLPVEFPAVADLEVTLALSRAARSSGAPVRVGVAQSKDSFYGQHEQGRMPVVAHLAARSEAWVGGGAICSEMEAAALFVVASILRVRAGAIVTIHPLDNGRPGLASTPPPLDQLIDVAVNAMVDLLGQDQTSNRTVGQT